MPRHGDRADVEIAQRNRLAVPNLPVVSWKRRWRSRGPAPAAAACRRVLHQAPIRRGNVDLGSIPLLKVRRSAKVIRVPVRDENHLDLRRVEAELLKTRQQLRFDLGTGRLGIVAAKRVDHEQARRRADDVYGRTAVANRKHVVENPGRRNRRVVGPIGARRLAPEMNGVPPARPDGCPKPVDHRLDVCRVWLGGSLRRLLGGDGRDDARQQQRRGEANESHCPSRTTFVSTGPGRPLRRTSRSSTVPTSRRSGCRSRPSASRS